MPRDRAVRAVAFIEATKGVVVLGAATGLVSLGPRAVHAAALFLVEHSHLNPASRYPRIFLDAAAQIGDTRLLLLAAGAALYALVRLVEAWGLYFERTWAEVLAAGSGAIYVPFECLELVRHPGWATATLLAVNLAIVGIMLRALLHHRAASTP